jgi:hypothetical protein
MLAEPLECLESFIVLALFHVPATVRITTKRFRGVNGKVNGARLTILGFPGRGRLGS